MIMDWGLPIDEPTSQAQIDAANAAEEAQSAADYKRMSELGGGGFNPFGSISDMIFQNNTPKVDLIGSVSNIVQQTFEGAQTAFSGAASVNFDLIGTLTDTAKQIGFDAGNLGTAVARGTNQLVTDLTKHTTDQLELGVRTIGGALQVGTQRAGDWGHQAIQDAAGWVQTVLDNAGGVTDKRQAAEAAQAALDRQNAELTQLKSDELTRKERQDIGASTKAGINQQGYTGGYNLGGSSVQNYNTSKDFLGL